MKYILSSLLVCITLVSCKESGTGELKFIFSSESDLPKSFPDWLKYEDITKEQQHTIDVIFENNKFKGIEKNKKGARTIAEGAVLDLGGSEITNLDPVLSLKMLSTLYLLPNPELTQEEVNKLEVLTQLRQLIVPDGIKCPKQFPFKYGEICIKKEVK